MLYTASMWAPYTKYSVCVSHVIRKQYPKSYSIRLTNWNLWVQSQTGCFFFVPFWIPVPLLTAPFSFQTKLDSWQYLPRLLETRCLLQYIGNQLTLISTWTSTPTHHYLRVISCWISSLLHFMFAEFHFSCILSSLKFICVAFRLHFVGFHLYQISSS